ncbi:hypothetical protein ACFWJY_35775 [Streptomyces anulatus]|uniref:hypothetical protein n=1 Tax=Streptomyces anulatus TaxID=1892 RepID=UPI00365CEC15
MAYEDCTYHGIQVGPETRSNDDDMEWRPVRIVVETPEFGPTQRETLTVLRELTEPEGGEFDWGFNGTGTSNAAAVILADALGLGDPEECGISFLSVEEDKTLGVLREDFCDDVLSQCCDEWRLRRGAVLRWARAWYLQQGNTDLPAALQELPPLWHEGRP